MTDPPDNSTRVRYLLTSLVIILIFILALLVLLVAYPVVFAPAPTITPTLTITPTKTSTITPFPTITETPEPTRTSQPSLTPSITLIPSQTPTPSLTPTLSGPPTLTPANPIKGKDYSLEEWSPDLADYMVRLMDDYPNSLSGEERGEDDEGYYAAFYYATIAQKEAILRYPDAPQAVFWEWGLAYNLAQIGDPQASEAYGELITQHLNDGDIDVDELKSWFEFQEDRLDLEILELAPIQGYQSSYLIEISGGGSAFILLLETRSGFRYYVLVENFDFVNDPQFESFAEDLTGDGLEEIVIYPLESNKELTLTPPLVYSTEQIPPTILDFNQATANYLIGMDFSSQWTADTNPMEEKQLTFKTSLFPPCRVVLSRAYYWIDILFDPTDMQYQVIPYPDTLSYCSYIVDHSANFWGPEAAIQIMEPILPDWPPEVDENGDPHPPDAQDEWRYRLGVYHALLGHFGAAVNYFEGIISEPSTQDSRWIAPSELFLSKYTKAEDVYKACLTTEYCDPRLALTFLVENLTLDDYPNALTQLALDGVITTASGEFDFEGIDQEETWFTIRHHELEKLEYWILSPFPEGIEPIFVSVVDSSRPSTSYYEDDSNPPIVLLDNTIAFSIVRVPGSSQPYLVIPDLPDTYPNRFEEGLQKAMDALFSGANPAIVKADLLLLQENPGLLCKPYWSCDLYYYILGLASELSGDGILSVDSYLYLWWNYSKSPFTTMARLKLEGATLPHYPTPTSTTTLTPSMMSTPLTITPSLITPSATTVTTPTPVTPYPGPEQSPTPVIPYPGPVQSPTAVTPYP